MAGAHRNPLLTRHAQALDLFTQRVHDVHDDQWQTPTPCADWNVRDLVNHLTAEQLWVTPLVAEGSTVEALGDTLDGDVLGSDPVATWDDAAQGARATFGTPGALERTVHLSAGDTEAVRYCSEMVADLVVHTWDLARAVGSDERLPAELVNFSVRKVTPHAAMLEQSGLFAAPVPPPKDADIQTKLLCLLGRRP